jgi:subtilisin family serine protease
MGQDPDHGTHVTGIIGAQRNNDIGVDGIADNVAGDDGTRITTRR